MLDMPISELKDWRILLKGSENSSHGEKLAQALQEPGLQFGFASNGSLDCRGGCTRLFYTGMPPYKSARTSAVTKAAILLISTRWRGWMCRICGGCQMQGQRPWTS